MSTVISNLSYVSDQICGPNSSDLIHTSSLLTSMNLLIRPQYTGKATLWMNNTESYLHTLTPLKAKMPLAKCQSHLDSSSTFKYLDLQQEQVCVATLTLTQLCCLSLGSAHLTALKKGMRYIRAPV